MPLIHELNDVLVAVDFSRHSRTALFQACRIALRHHAKLHVLHVVDAMAVQTLADMRHIPYEKQAALSEDGARTALTAWMKEAGTPCESRMITVVDVPVEGILAQVEKIQPGLLVVGMAGAGETTCGSGTIAAKLARKASCMVLLLRAGHEGKFRHIVACVDFSYFSERIVEEAARFAWRDEAHLELLHVWREPWVVSPSTDVSEYPVIIFTEDEKRKHQENLKIRLHALVEPLVEHIDTSEVLKEVINYGPGIVDHVSKTDADLVVIGNKRASGIKHFFLGSTAEKLLNIISCSLLIVKPAPEEEV